MERAGHKTLGVISIVVSVLAVLASLAVLVGYANSSHSATAVDVVAMVVIIPILDNIGSVIGSMVFWSLGLYSCGRLLSATRAHGAQAAAVVIATIIICAAVGWWYHADDNPMGRSRFADIAGASIRGMALGAIFARLLTGHRADHPVANPVTDAPRVRRAGRLSLLLIAAAVIAAVGLAGVKAWLHARAQGTYFGFYTQGDKPAIGLQVDLDDMVCTGATLFILSPDYPADRTGIAYPLTIGSASHTGFWCYTTIMNRGKTQKWEYIGTEQRLGDDVITVDLLPEGENTGASQRIVMHRGGPGELKAPPPTAKDD